MNNIISFWPIAAAIIALIIFFAVKTKKSNSQPSQPVTPAPTGHATIIPPVVSPPQPPVEQTAQNTNPAPVYATPGSGWIAAVPPSPHKEPAPAPTPVPVVNRPAPVTAPSPTGGSAVSRDQVLTINFDHKVPHDEVTMNDAMFLVKMNNTSWMYTGPAPFNKVSLWFAMLQGTHTEINQAVNPAFINVVKMNKFDVAAYTGPFKALLAELEDGCKTGKYKLATMDGETGQIIG